MGIFIDNYLQGYDSFGFIQIVHGHAINENRFYFFSTLAKTEIVYPKNVGALVAMNFT